MSLLTVDVGGANETVLRLVRSTNLERREIGKRRVAFAGNRRSMIRAEKIVWSGALIAVPASDAALIRSLFARGAIVNCEGDVFNNGNTTIACMGEITDEMEVGTALVTLALTLRETDGAVSSLADDTTGSPLLINWYDAQGTNYTALGLSDDDPLLTWPDESGNGFDATSGDASNTGHHADAALNGHPGVYFQPLGNNQRGYDLPNAYAPTDGEAFIVLRCGPAVAPAPNGGGAFWMFGASTVGTGPNAPEAAGGTFRDNFGSTVAHGFPLGIDPTEPFLYHVRAKAGRWRAWINGVLQHSTSINTLVWPPVPHLGMWLSGGAFYTPYCGWIGEAKFYDGSFAPSAAATEEAAIMTKWDIP